MKYVKLGICLLALVVTAIVLMYLGATEPGKGQVAEQNEAKWREPNREFKNDRDEVRALPSNWYRRQRAYPHDSIPQEQVQLALGQAQDMRAAYLASKQSEIDPTWVAAGPTNRPGRVVAVAVHPSDPKTIYAGSAQGGVFKTTKQRQSWTPNID